MKLLECQTYYSDTEKKIVTKSRTLNLKYLGEKNKFKFYKVSSINSTDYLSGEITIDTCRNVLVYSREVNRPYIQGKILSTLHKISKCTYRGLSEKIDIPENNGIILKFI